MQHQGEIMQQQETVAPVIAPQRTGIRISGLPKSPLRLLSDLIGQVKSAACRLTCTPVCVMKKPISSLLRRAFNLTAPAGALVVKRFLYNPQSMHLVTMFQNIGASKAIIAFSFPASISISSSPKMSLHGHRSVRRLHVPPMATSRAALLPADPFNIEQTRLQRSAPATQP